MVNFRTVHKNALRAVCSAALILGTASGAMAQAADEAGDKYAALLKQISDIKIEIAHKQAVVKTQDGQIESLRDQLKNADGIMASIGPMVDKMTAAIESEVDKDIPFNGYERFERLGLLQDTVADAEALPGEKFRRALNMYEAEVIYGQTFASYPGENPFEDRRGKRYAACLEDQESAVCALTNDHKAKIRKGATIEGLKGDLQDGDYLRYGRLALIYAEADSSQVLQYNPTTKAWDEVGGSRALDFLQAVKMAKGEAAVNVVRAPVYIAE